MLIQMTVPTLETQLFPLRHFPAVWRSATTSVPWGAHSPASFLALIFVESVSSKYTSLVPLHCV